MIEPPILLFWRRTERTRRVLMITLGAALALMFTWLAVLLHQRSRLAMEYHLLRHHVLPFVPLGRPISHPDGRIFMLSADGQLMALSKKGELLWNKRLKAEVTPQPVMVQGRLLVLQGEGRLLGYSLGGELAFEAVGLGALGDLPCADEDGGMFLLDRDGSLVGVSQQGEVTLRAPLGVHSRRRIISLGSGLLLLGGAHQGRPLLMVAERDGQVRARLLLDGHDAPSGLAASPLSGEIGAAAIGAHVVTLGRDGARRRMVPLPARAVGAPLLLEDGSIAVLLAGSPSVRLCLLDGGTGAAAPRFCVPAMSPFPEGGLPVGPLLGRDRRLYAAFDTRSGSPLLPRYEGVLSVSLEGGVFRQQLPERVRPDGLTLDFSGGVLAIVEGQRFVWQLEGGQPGSAPYHPFPMPDGSPAGSSAPWRGPP